MYYYCHKFHKFLHAVRLQVWRMLFMFCVDSPSMSFFVYSVMFLCIDLCLGIGVYTDCTHLFSVLSLISLCLIMECVSFILCHVLVTYCAVQYTVLLFIYFFIMCTIFLYILFCILLQLTALLLELCNISFSLAYYKFLSCINCDVTINKTKSNQ